MRTASGRDRWNHSTRWAFPTSGLPQALQGEFLSSYRVAIRQCVRRNLESEPDRGVVPLGERPPVPVPLVRHEEIQPAERQLLDAVKGLQVVTAVPFVERLTPARGCRGGPAAGEGVEPPQRVRQGPLAQPPLGLPVSGPARAVPKLQEPLQLVHAGAGAPLGEEAK